jgi:hypothetical protein
MTGRTGSELQAMWQAGGGNLIQEAGYFPSVSVNLLYPDSIQPRHRHPC